jgi:hypothetical protein
MCAGSRFEAATVYESDWESVASIKGPVAGFYLAVAAWKVPDQERRFNAYVKLCRERPEDYWTAQAFWKGVWEGSACSAEEALQSALKAAEVAARGLRCC